MAKQLRELYFAAAITIVSLLLMIQSFRYPPESSDFPRFLTILMTLFSLALFAKSWLKYRSETSENQSINLKAIIESQKTPAIVFFATGAYVAGMNYIGYFTSSVIFIIGMMLFFTRSKKWTVMIVSTAGFLVVVYALFVWFLKLRMPQGFLM